ncbi:MAG: hypothetical protein KF861_12035 [Planctomycetaceae bacterium]|nr:hypothetical protein [Planctomycetaceae bacterium]
MSTRSFRWFLYISVLCSMAALLSIPVIYLSRKHSSLATLETSGGHIEYSYQAQAALTGIPLWRLVAFDDWMGWAVIGEPAWVGLGIVDQNAIAAVARTNTIVGVSSWDDCSAPIEAFYPLVHNLKMEQFTVCVSGGDGDRLLELARSLPRLRWIILSGCRVTDKGLNHLAGHASLERLELYGEEVVLTDASARVLSQIPKLDELVLGNNAIVSDAVIQEGARLGKEVLRTPPLRGGNGSRIRVE